jgi:hypothetical protein
MLLVTVEQRDKLLRNYDNKDDDHIHERAALAQWQMGTSRSPVERQPCRLCSACLLPRYGVPGASMRRYECG